jgi:hemolysin D
MMLLRSAPERREPTLDHLIRTFQSETAEIEEMPGPARKQKAVLLLAFLLVSLIAISASFRVDRVVTSIFGQIVTVEPTTVLQPLDQSIIKTIDVQEGDRVKKGQLLATLDPTFATADVNALRLQLASLDAEIARCEAELAERPFMFTPGNGPGAAKYAALQRTLFEQRKAQHDAQMNDFKAQIAQARATIEKLQQDEARYGDREQLAQQIENMRLQLTRQQYGSRLNLLVAADQKVEMLRNLQSDQNTLAETQQQIQAILAQRDAFTQRWRAQTSQELVNARNQQDAAREQLDKALKRKNLVRLIAPEDAIVLRLAKLSVGSVLQPGETFIELALLRSPVEAEIYLNPRDVGFVHPGDDTTIKLDPYNFVNHGWAEGRLRWISEGTFTTPESGTAGVTNPAGTSPGNPAIADPNQATTGRLTTPFYKARVTITKLDLKNVPKHFRLLPGMTLTADIHVGTRSLFWYLARGLVRNVDEAMREP